jgi:ABC-type lipoprotein export system ATPase subunit
MIEAVNLSKVYWDGDRTLEVLKNITFAARRGEGIAILGPSGSGKTTLLNLLSGLDRPSAGEVRLDGRPLGRMSESAKASFRNRHVGFVFQFYHLLSEFTALENVMLPALIGAGRRDRRAARERAEGLLARVGLGDRMKHFPAELSGGEQQRAAIARALMNDPKILFCDEPTGNLDAQMGRGIADLLKGFFAERDKTVLIVTHDERIAQTADRVWEIASGSWRR